VFSRFAAVLRGGGNHGGNLDSRGTSRGQRDRNADSGGSGNWRRLTGGFIPWRVRAHDGTQEIGRGTVGACGGACAELH